MQDGDFRWADVYVTEVIDACHFWAHVGGKMVIEKMEEINKELLSQVNNKGLVSSIGLTSISYPESMVSPVSGSLPG